MAEQCNGKTHPTFGAGAWIRTGGLAYVSTGLCHLRAHDRCVHQGCSRSDEACRLSTDIGTLRSSHSGRKASSATTCGKHADTRAGTRGFVPICSRGIDEWDCICLNRKGWALNSAVECHLHTVEVIGSNPIAPTIWSFPRFYCILSIPISMPFW